jgi:hypothetical protein
MSWRASHHADRYICCKILDGPREGTIPTHPRRMAEKCISLDAHLVASDPPL